MKTTRKDDRPDNYHRIKPILDRISKLTHQEDLVSVAAFVVGILDAANDYEGLRIIGESLREPLDRWLKENHPEEKRILLVQ